MIKSFRHKGLKRLYDKGEPQRVPADMLAKIRAVLADLDAAQQPDDLRLPGYNLHPLKGDLKNSWSLRMTGNWRIIFQMEDGDVHQVDLVDYH